MKLSHPEDFNIDLAEKVLDHIKIHPEAYSQNHHDRCLIGWAGRLEAKERGRYRWRRLLESCPILGQGSTAQLHPTSSELSR